MAVDCQKILPAIPLTHQPWCKTVGIMTNTKRCHDCQTHPIDFSTQGRDSTYCTACYEYAGWENTHTDEDHDPRDADAHTLCPVCRPELDPRNGGSINTPVSRPAQRGNKNAAGKQESHKHCGHPLTKSARQRCRAQRKKNESAPDVCPVCSASGDDKCTTRTGGRYKGKGGRHPQRDAR